MDNKDDLMLNHQTTLEASLKLKAQPLPLLYQILLLNFLALY